MKSYYQMSADEVRMQVNGKLTPLTDEEVKAHQEQYGKNELTEGKKKSTFQIFLEQFKDFLVIILIIAAIVSGFMGDVESAAVILIVITMNAILGTVQTVKAEQSLQSLKKLSGPVAKVLRNGKSCSGSFIRTYHRRRSAVGGRGLCSGRWTNPAECQS